jgi:hypothetical protein
MTSSLFLSTFHTNAFLETQFAFLEKKQKTAAV